ncbi:MAG: alpha-L-fucosidase [Ruminococcaceae bacterium]|nr:alpha-L-fucosidase [Oscillospiraceae bacterium]
MIPTPEKYVADFEKMGFGMFAHWGLYSQLGMGEWTYHIHQRPKEEYMKLKDTFTAEDFNADEFVLTAKNAGCKYITLTTRHHEGFSLYDTKGLNDYDAPHSPAGRDLIKEFVDACNRHGIMPMFYHTTLDWYNEDFEKDFDKYLEYLRRSVEVLCTSYGKIGGLWFDGNWSKPAGTDWKEDELYATIRKHQPEAIIVNNTGLGERGKTGNPEIDSVTFEQGRPTPLNREGMEKYVAAEMCYTLNDHWGIGENDFNYKSPAELIETLCACRRVGANLLLNIGPTAQGGIDSYQKAVMEVMGKWMKLYGEAIYEGKPYAATCKNEKNFVLKGDGCLYFFMHNIGRKGNANVTVGGEASNDYVFDGITEEIESVEWLDNGERFDFKRDGNKVELFATGYPYGMSTCVRVAKAKMK